MPDNSDNNPERDLANVLATAQQWGIVDPREGRGGEGTPSDRGEDRSADHGANHGLGSGLGQGAIAGPNAAVRDAGKTGGELVARNDPPKYRQDDPEEPAVLRHYRTSCTPEELYQRLVEQEGILELNTAPTLDAGALVVPTKFIVERQPEGFRVYCGEIGRESSATGILPNLQLRADFVPVGRDTHVELRFVYRRSGWAWQRVLGLGLTGLGGLLWVFLASGGLFWDRAMLYAAFLLFVSPVIFRDLRAKARREQEKLALLNLVEGTFGGLALTEAENEPSPYRSR